MTSVFRSLRRSLALMVLVLPLAPIAQTGAAAPSAIPGFPDLAKSVDVSIIVSGPAGELPSAPWLVIEQVDIAEGDSLPALSTTQIIVNEEGELSLVDDLGLEAALPEGEGLHVPAGEMGDLTAASDTTILRVTLASGEPKNAALVAAKLADDAPDPADLWFARVTLPAGASLGDATTVGLTAIVALDADLAVVRPGRLPATLPADKGVLLPTSTQLEVRNDGQNPATVLLAGLSPSDQEAASATTSSTPRATSTPEPRGSTRDVSPSPTRSSGGSTGSTGNSTAATIDDYLPSSSTLSQLGFTPRERNSYSDPSDSWFDMSASTESAWLGSTDVIYTDRSGRVLFISLERFRTDAAASNLIRGISDFWESEDVALDDPYRGAFDDTAAKYDPNVDGDLASGAVIARDGRNIIMVVVQAELYGDTDVVFDVFDAVSEAVGWVIDQPSLASTDGPATTGGDQRMLAVRPGVRGTFGLPSIASGNPVVASHLNLRAQERSYR